MKKTNLILIALMALIFVSCSEDETTMSMPKDNAIEFGTYVGRDAQTRASVFETSDLAAQGFGVFAYYTGTDPFATGTHTANFMNNQQVTGDGASNPVEYTWTYSPIKYWPNNDGDKVTFLAYAPWVKDKAIDEGKVDFTVESEIKDQTDLVWNTTEYINVTKQDIDGKVDFKFGHALARIGLLLEAAVDQVAVGGALDVNTEITVNSVTFSNLFYKKGTLDLTKTVATWTTAPTTDGLQGFVLDYVNPETETDKNDLQNNVIKADSHNAAKQLNLDNSYLMVIPQDFSSTGFDVTVDYNVVTTVPEGETLTGGGDSNIKNTITRTVNLKLEAGKAYTLKLHIGMNSVDITASVEEWKDVADTVVNVPKNEE